MNGKENPIGTLSRLHMCLCHLSGTMGVLDQGVIKMEETKGEQVEDSLMSNKCACQRNPSFIERGYRMIN